MPPRGETIGRGMKVNKEEILGMLVAVEEFVKIDHDAEALIFLERIKKYKLLQTQYLALLQQFQHPY